MALQEGYTKFNSDLKEDAESLMVKPGCVLIGYDEERSGFFEGHNAVFDARDRSTRSNDPLINDNLDDDELDEEMKAADCYCQTARGVGNVGRLSGSRIEGGGLLNSAFGSSSHCNDQIAIFNRPGPLNSRPAALLFDEPDCTGRMKEVGVGDTNLQHTFSEDLDDDVESIMVRPGCTLIGTDHTKSNLLGQGRNVTIDASRNRNEPAARNLSGSRDLEEDISAVSVRCRS